MRPSLIAAAVLCLALVPTGCVSVRESAQAAMPEPTLVTLPPVPAPSLRPEPSRSRAIPRRIDQTGETDVAAELQAFVDGVPDRSRIVFPQGATYRLGTAINVFDRHDLVFEGNGATLLITGCGADDSAFTIGRWFPSSRITIRGFTITGQNTSAGTEQAFVPECEHTHGVSIHASEDIELDDLHISQTFGDCVYVGGGGFEQTVGVHFHDSTCQLIGRQGFTITSGAEVRVERVAFDKIAIMAFDIEPNEASDAIRDVLFTDNIVGTTGHSDRFEPQLFGANGNLDAEVRNVTVSNNTVTGGTLYTIVGDEEQGWSGGRNHHDIVFVGNRSDTPTRGPVLFFKHVDGLQVYGNQQPLTSGDLVFTEDTIDADIH